MKRIRKIISGGQTGADRAGIDFAISKGIEYGGWCPHGGWAEDYPDPPGLLKVYTEMKEADSSGTTQRTTLNVRDSDATVILSTNEGIATSPGTEITIEILEQYGKPYRILNINEEQSLDIFRSFIAGLPDGTVLNLAGPRESQNPGLYEGAFRFLEQGFADLN